MDTTLTLEGPDMYRTVSEFFEGLLGSDPFSSNRVNGPDRCLVTVAEIHRREFEQLCRLTTQVHAQNRALGVLLWSGAGVGKSHLLARLCDWVEREEKAVYLYLHNVLVSAENTPRHFLKSVVSTMVEGGESFKESPLYDMVHAVIKRGLKQNQIPPHTTPQKAYEAFLSATQTLPLRKDRLNEVVFEVVFNFFVKVNMNPEIRGPVREDVNAIVDWLSGDGISEELARQIGITPQPRDRDVDGLVRLQDNHQVEQVFLILAALCHVAGRSLLIVIDQVDNMRESVSSLAEFCHSLLDHCQNLLLVTAGVKETIKKMLDEGAISEAQRDRIAEKIIDLHQIEPRQARDILESRLRPFQDKARELPEIRRMIAASALFPLAEKDFELRFGQVTELQPRSVVKWASIAWETEQNRIRELGGEEWLGGWNRSAPPTVSRSLEDVIDEAVSETLNDLIADRRKHAGMLPADADNLATVTERLLQVCRGRAAYTLESVERIPGDKPYSLDITERLPGTRSELVRTAVAIVASRNGTVARHPIQRLCEKVPGDIQHRILVTDEERTPLPMTPSIVAHYAKLTNLGPDRFQHIKLTFQQYVELDALRTAMDDAVNIAIEYPNRTQSGLTREEVAESLHRQGRFLAHPLLKELLTEPSAKPATPPAIAQPPVDLIATIILGSLGWKICVMTNDVTSEVLKQPGLSHLDFQQTHERVVKVAEELVAESKILSRVHLNGLLLMNAQ
jgi:hypothetical protein